MITDIELSKRLLQFFEGIFANNKIDFGFSSVDFESFREEDINQSARLGYDFNSDDFISTDLDLAKWKTALVGSRTIDVYIRAVLGKSIAEIPAMTIDELLIALNTIILISNFYDNIGVSSFTLDKKINDLLEQAQTGNVSNITAIRRLNKMLLCSIYQTEIFTSSTYLTARNITTILYYRIEQVDNLGNGISSATISYDDDGNEVITEQKRAEIVFNILSKDYKALNAINFFNFAIESERKNIACYSQDLDFNLILIDRTKPLSLNELEQGAWLKREEQRLIFKYDDTITLDEVASLQIIDSFEKVKDVIQHQIEIKEI